MASTRTKPQTIWSAVSRRSTAWEHTMLGLYRPRHDRILGGVAAGLAYRFGLPVWLMRLFWIFLCLPGGLPGVVPYLILWVVMPSE
jgi:phage shock protein PspC (stress-responsive transcriptional regulator)